MPHSRLTNTHILISYLPQEALGCLATLSIHLAAICGRLAGRADGPTLEGVVVQEVVLTQLWV